MKIKPNRITTVQQVRDFLESTKPELIQMYSTKEIDMFEEFKLLDIRVNRNMEYVESDEIDSEPEHVSVMLNEQLNHMIAYRKALASRIMMIDHIKF